MIYMLIAAIRFIAQRLPRSASLRLGSGLGDLVYRTVRRRRQIALSNLRMVFGRDRKDEELRRIARRSFQNMGKTLVEFLSFPAYGIDRVMSLVRVEGAENFRQAMSMGKGLIVTTGHLGNWELISYVIASMTDRFSAVVLPFRNRRLDELVNRYRTIYGGGIIEKKMAVKQSLKLLREGYCIAILVDQDAGDSGVFVDFLGVPASAARGPIVLALRTGAPVISIFSIRQSDDSHLVTISKPLKLEISGDVENDVKVNTARLAGLLEEVVRRYPCQWLWMHNRWKTRPLKLFEKKLEQKGENGGVRPRSAETPEPRRAIAVRSRKVLVLSDGKPGHYNQSLGIMDRMRDVSTQVIEVRFKRKWRDDLLRILARLTGGINLPRDMIKAMLKWAVERSSAIALLEANHFDAILSTGSSVAAPNLLLGRLINAKSVVCTRPSPVGIAHFHLAILPEHMRPRHPSGNVTMTLGVPNRITPEYVDKMGKSLAERLNVSRQRIIGLLLGGNDPYYSIPPGMVSSLCDVLLDICRAIGARLALTTSRRTDPKSEDVIKSKMLNNPLCCLSVLASESLCALAIAPHEERENPVPGIIGMSEVSIVTEDSFSMVCEAASSGKKIVILKVERKKGGHPKRQRVYQLLVERGYARSSDVPSLKDTVLDFIRDPIIPGALDDAQTAANALRNLIS